MEAHDRKARRARLRLAGMAVIAAGILTAVGVVAADALSDGGPGNSSAQSPEPSGAAKPTSSSSTAASSGMTPGKAKPLRLVASKRQQGGAPLGFPKDGAGAVSAAVAYWEEYAFLDDSLARKQLEALVSPDSRQTIDEHLSELHKLREGLGLPPSGPAPADTTFSTVVKAARPKALTDDGSVVHLWLQYDRYATGPDGGGDDSPLKDEFTEVIMKWQGGEWRITEEEKYTQARSFAVAYDPNSEPAWADGWMRVARAS